MSGGDNDFESLMEESLKAPRTGDVLVGRVLLVTRDSVIIDINYKCEGQVPLAEFLDADGNVSVKEGDEVDVYFEGTETENGTVLLSHAKAEKFKVWRELEKAFQSELAVEGVVLESDPPRRLVYTWVIRYDAAFAHETSRVTWLIEPRGSSVCQLTLTHDVTHAPLTAPHVTGGWPFILSGIKTLLETGEPLVITP